jgi:hypothetical protein
MNNRFYQAIIIPHASPKENYSGSDVAEIRPLFPVFFTHSLGMNMPGEQHETKRQIHKAHLA